MTYASVSTNTKPAQSVAYENLYLCTVVVVTCHTRRTVVLFVHGRLTFPGGFLGMCETNEIAPNRYLAPIKYSQRSTVNGVQLQLSTVISTVIMVLYLRSDSELSQIIYIFYSTSKRYTSNACRFLIYCR